jgi:hypothetical protein
MLAHRVGFPPPQHTHHIAAIWDYLSRINHGLLTLT